jgi:hypothetical protein
MFQAKIMMVTTGYEGRHTKGRTWQETEEDKGKKKVKLSLCLIIKQYAMKEYGMNV